MPSHGRALLVANHAGILPWDGTMMSVALLKEHPLPRWTHGRVTLLAADPRVGSHAPSLLDAPKAGSGFSVHADEFISGTPAQVTEQIIEQCRACGAGHILAILGRAIDERRAEAVKLFGEEVIPRLRDFEPY